MPAASSLSGGAAGLLHLLSQTLAQSCPLPIPAEVAHLAVRPSTWRWRWALVDPCRTLDLIQAGDVMPASWPNCAGSGGL